MRLCLHVVRMESQQIITPSCMRLALLAGSCQSCGWNHNTIPHAVGGDHVDGWPCLHVVRMESQQIITPLCMRYICSSFFILSISSFLFSISFFNFSIFFIFSCLFSSSVFSFSSFLYFLILQCSVI